MRFIDCQPCSSKWACKLAIRSDLPGPRSKTSCKRRSACQPCAAFVCQSFGFPGVWVLERVIALRARMHSTYSKPLSLILKVKYCTTCASTNKLLYEGSPLYICNISCCCFLSLILFGSQHSSIVLSFVFIDQRLGRVVATLS